MATVVLRRRARPWARCWAGPWAASSAGRWARWREASSTSSCSAPQRTRRRGRGSTDLRVMASTEGAPIPRLWGRMRVAGQVIWATDFEEKHDRHAGGKGGGGGGAKVRTYSYFANFAVALCEGEIDRIGRVWADGKPFDISGVTARLYTRQRDAGARQPDRGEAGGGQCAGLSRPRLCGVRAAAAGALRQPAAAAFLRGDPRRRRAPRRMLRAVSIIPGSTEFGYDTAVVTREVDEGVTEPENAHAAAGAERLERVARTSCTSSAATWRGLAGGGLVRHRPALRVLRGAARRRQPAEATEPETWQVSGTARGDAYLVSVERRRPGLWRNALRCLGDPRHPGPEGARDRR